MKILDCTYTHDYDGSPIIHLWGVGGKHITRSGHRPYFFAEFNKNISSEVAAQLLHSRGIYDFERVKKFRPIGYQSKPTTMYKIYTVSPGDVRQLRDEVSRIPNIFKIYEADVPYKTRWLIDNELGGFADVGNSEDASISYCGFDIECLVPPEGTMPTSDKDPVILISMAFSPKFEGNDRVVLSTKPTNYEGCPVVICKDERQLITTFLSFINMYNPDIIAGYNSNQFDFQYLDGRCKALKISPKCARNNREWNIRPRFDGGVDVAITGRVVVDLLPIIRKNYSLPQYTLREAAKLVKKEKLDISPGEMRKSYFEDHSESWDRVVEYSDRDAELVMSLLLDLKLIDKYIALSETSGLLLQDVINSGQTQMIEFMFMKKFLIRDRVMNMRPHIEDEDEDEIRYAGATVLTPKDKVQENAVILDYRSLYPTIIMAHNISYDTIILQNEEFDGECEVSPTGARFVKSNVLHGVMPEILEELFSKRLDAKDKMKMCEGPERDYWDAQQYAYKILMNSMYGFSGYIRSKLFTIEIAESVTSWGRANLEATIQLVNDMGYTVLYGDSDSIFVKCNIDNNLSLDEKLSQMKAIGNEIAMIATKKLPQPMALAFEAIAIRAIFLSKKRYAMWRFEETSHGWEGKLKAKGIALIRRDWAPITGKILRTCLNYILIDGDVLTAAKYTHERIVELKQLDLKKSGEFIDDLLLTRRYGGDLGKYKTDPVHIKLIRRMIERGEPAPSSGDRIPFIIINEYEGTFSDKGENPEYAISRGYTIDVDYYLKKQIMKPVAEIFEPFGITSAMLERGIFERVDKPTKQKTLFDL